MIKNVAKFYINYLNQDHQVVEKMIRSIFLRNKQCTALYKLSKNKKNQFFPFITNK